VVFVIEEVYQLEVKEQERTLEQEKAAGKLLLERKKQQVKNNKLGKFIIYHLIKIFENFKKIIGSLKWQKRKSKRK
jgi:endo-1,4-beta-D-glucanase Y